MYLEKEIACIPSIRMSSVHTVFTALLIFSHFVDTVGSHVGLFGSFHLWISKTFSTVFVSISELFLKEESILGGMLETFCHPFIWHCRLWHVAELSCPPTHTLPPRPRHTQMVICVAD